MTPERWLFADQLGPHFLGPADDPGDDGSQRVLLVESTGVFRRRTYHRAKAHIILSALRHRAAELGDRATLVRAETYREAVLDRAVDACAPTSWPARHLLERLGIPMLPARGFVLGEDEFASWAEGRRGRLRQEDLYRETRRRTGVLMEGDEPVGGRWNLDEDNRMPPPKGATDLGLPDPSWPREDAIDEEVRADLDRWERDEGISFLGVDGPRRFAVTRDEALAVLDDFVAHRLTDFGPYEDAMLERDWVMAHSLLSVPLNLGLLHPMEVVDAVVGAYDGGGVPLSSVEGLCRQVIGWREYVWHLYWWWGPDYASTANALDARTPLPEWFATADSAAVGARCLSSALEGIRDRGWVHHIQRLMVLGNWALQRGYDPAETNDWFRRACVDGFAWVMPANVVGMALYADGGRMATKPYAAGGAYINRMSDSCRTCRYRPTERVGEQACPFTAGYWAFLDRHADTHGRNPRIAAQVRGRTRLADLSDLVAAEAARGDGPP